MGVLFADLGAAVHFPEAQCAIGGGSAEDVGIPAEDGAGDARLMATQGVEFVAGFAFPYPDAAVAISAGEQHSVR